MASSCSSLLHLLVWLFLLPLNVSAQCSKSICSDGSALPFPDREIFIEGENVITCGELEASAASDTTVCDSLPDFEYYCGCLGVESPCGLCPDGPLDDFFEGRVLKGYEPSWFPSENVYTCEVANRMLSLVGDKQKRCNTTRDEIKDIQRLCGCSLPKNANCTALCSDGTLIDPSFFDTTALVEQPKWGTGSCQEMQMVVARGQLNFDECDAANYIGHKRCGCQETRPFCDLCEDGSVPNDLAKEVTYFRNCYEHAGDAFKFDRASDVCKAYRSSLGEYCGCNNPVASQGACRICDVNGGAVVPDSNMTIEVGSLFADCGELEFAGNEPKNPLGFTCEDVTDFGVECCSVETSVPSAAPTKTEVPISSAPSTTTTLRPTTLTPTTPTPTTLRPTTLRPTTLTPTTLRPTTPAPTIPAAPPPSQNIFNDCTVCGAGVPLPFPDRLILSPEQENRTCADMEAEAALNPNLCPDLHALAFYCGCPRETGKYCAMCPNGTLVSKPDLVLEGYEPDWFPKDINFTCDVAERIHSLDSVGSCANDTEVIATLCGCFAPTVNNCTTLCPDGTLIDPSFRNTLVVQDYPILGTMTCEDFQLHVAKGNLYTEDCDAASYAGVKLCGCQETLPYCDMCEDGSVAPDLQREVTYGRTCLDYAGDGYFLDPNDSVCPTYQATYGRYCGCDNAVSSNTTCYICGDDPVPDSNYTLTLGQELIDCGNLEFAANNPQSPFTCEEATTVGAECCAVAPAPTIAPASPSPAPTTWCAICDSTALPFPDREVFIEGEENVTCGSLEALANGNSSTVKCADLSAYAFFCGCPLATSSCPICPGGTVPPKADLELKGYAPSWFPVNNSTYTCEVAEALNSLKTPTECNEVANNTRAIATLCGCFVPDAPNCSSLCPDGTLVDAKALDFAVFQNDPNVGDISCSDYQLLAASGELLAPECDAAHYVGIKNCGCSATRPFCDICEDGGTITDLGKEVTFGKTCLDHAADAYFSEPYEDVCLAIQASYGEYCGCGNTLASSGACRICDQRGGLVVPDSNQTVRVGDFMVECGNLEFTGNDPNAAFTCEHVRLFGQECCVGMATATPTSSPTAESNAPTTAVSSAPTLKPTDGEGTTTTSGALAPSPIFVLWGMLAIICTLVMVI